MPWARAASTTSLCVLGRFVWQASGCMPMVSSITPRRMRVAAGEVDADLHAVGARASCTTRGSRACLRSGPGTCGMRRAPSGRGPCRAAERRRPRRLIASSALEPTGTATGWSSTVTLSSAGASTITAINYATPFVDDAHARGAVPGLVLADRVGKMSAATRAPGWAPSGQDRTASRTPARRSARRWSRAPQAARRRRACRRTGRAGERCLRDTVCTCRTTRASCTRRSRAPRQPRTAGSSTGTIPPAPRTPPTACRGCTSYGVSSSDGGRIEPDGPPTSSAHDVARRCRRRTRR